MNNSLAIIQKWFVTTSTTSNSELDAFNALTDDEKRTAIFAKTCMHKVIFPESLGETANAIMQKRVKVRAPLMLIDVLTYSIQSVATQLLNEASSHPRRLLEALVADINSFSLKYFMAHDWFYSCRQQRHTFNKSFHVKILNLQECETKIRELVSRLEPVCSGTAGTQAVLAAEVVSLLNFAGMYLNPERCFEFENDMIIRHILLDYPWSMEIDPQETEALSFHQRLAFVTDYCAKLHHRVVRVTKELGGVGEQVTIFKELKTILIGMSDQVTSEAIREYERKALLFSTSQAINVARLNANVKMFHDHHLSIALWAEDNGVEPKKHSETPLQFNQRISSELTYRTTFANLMLMSVEDVLKLFHFYVTPLDNRFVKRQNASRLKELLSPAMTLLSGRSKAPAAPKMETVPDELKKLKLRDLWVELQKMNLRKILVDARSLIQRGYIQVEQLDELIKQLDTEEIDQGMWLRRRLALTPLFEFLTEWAAEIGPLVAKAESDFIAKIRHVPKSQRDQIVRSASNWMFQQKGGYRDLIDLLSLERFLIAAVHDKTYPEPTGEEYELMFLGPIRTFLNAFDADLINERLDALDSATQYSSIPVCARPEAKQLASTPQKKGPKVKTRPAQFVVPAGGGAAGAAAAAEPVVVPQEPESISWRRGTKTRELLRDLYDMGYERRRLNGDHLTLTNPSGHSVVVPVGKKEQKVGTMKSIAEQAERGNAATSDAK